MDPKIFITHSSKDEKVSRTVCTALENRGLACWISSRDVKPGQNFQEQIVKAIRTARIMVLVFTANANNSDEIKKELALASQHKLVVIPVRIEDVIPNEALAYELATRQWMNLFDDWENSIARLVELISAIIHDQPTSGGNKASSELTAGAAAPSIDKIVMTGAAPAVGRASLMPRLGSHWGLISGLVVIVAAVATYEIATLRQQTASVSETVTKASPPPSTAGDAEQAWNAIKESKNVADLESFIQRYGGTFFGDVARRKLEELKQAAADTEPAKPARRISFGPTSELVLRANGTWVELQAGTPVVMFRVVTDERDGLVLFDASRDLYLRLQYSEGQVYVRRGPLGAWGRFVRINKVVDERGFLSKDTK